MVDRVVIKERKTVRVSSKSWHGRAYRYWANSATWDYNPANPERKRENLCHYMRVVLFWVPLEWFFHAKSKRVPWLSPWMPTALVAFIAFMSVSFINWPAKTWRALGMFALAMLAIAALLGTAYVITVFHDWRRKRDRKEPRPDKGDGFLHVATEFARAKKAKVCPYIDLEDMG